MIIKSAITTKREQVGFITLETPVIKAWAYCDIDRGGYILGYRHGSTVHLPIGTPQDEIETAVMRQCEKWGIE